MTEQQLLQSAFAGLHLSPSPSGQHEQGQEQGRALLKLLQGHSHPSQAGYTAPSTRPAGFEGQAAAAGQAPPHSNGVVLSHPEQAVSSLFGAAGSSIWSSQPSAGISSSTAAQSLGPGSLWSDTRIAAGWPVQHTPAPHHQQAQAQPPVHQQPQVPQSSYQPPVQPVAQHALPFAQHDSYLRLPQSQAQQQPQPPAQLPAMHPTSQLPSHHPQSQASSGQPMQPRLPYLPHLTSMPPLQPADFVSQQQRPHPRQTAAPYNPLSALLHSGQQARVEPQQHYLPPQQHYERQSLPLQQQPQSQPYLPPQQMSHFQQQQQQQQQQAQSQQYLPPRQQQQQQQPALSDAQPGLWGHGALFAGLPAMRHLRQQEEAPQQQQHAAHMPSATSNMPMALPDSQLAPQLPVPQHQMAAFSLGAGLPHMTAAQGTAPAPARTPSPHLASEAGQRGAALQGGWAAGPLDQPALPRKPSLQRAVRPGLGRENRWVDVMDRSHDGREPRADMQQLDAALRLLADSLMPTPEERAAQVQAFERVRGLLQARYPGAQVHLFGSVANGLSVRHNNDLDVCLELPGVEDQAAKGEVALAVGELMEAAGMAEVLTLPKARVPVVKCVLPGSGTKVDITVNNLLACTNTKLLADYSAIDPRLASLVALVKHWAKQRAVNDPYRGTLSSYCYVLMCIHLLQTRPQPVLPVLQQLPATFRRTIGEWSCEFCDDVASLRGFGAANQESLAQLLWAFFEYWAWRHDYARDVVSIRLGGCLPKDDKDWTRRIGNERHLVCIEDPFELSHDLGRTVDRQTRAVLHKEFTRAATLMRDAEDPLDLLFQPYRLGRHA